MNKVHEKSLWSFPGALCYGEVFCKLYWFKDTGKSNQPSE
jgi:hypothetical protein